jgi:hypothetical protein
MLNIYIIVNKMYIFIQVCYIFIYVNILYTVNCDFLCSFICKLICIVIGLHNVNIMPKWYLKHWIFISV